MALRQALRADLDEVVDIWVEAFAGDPVTSDVPTPNGAAATLRPMVRRPA